MRLSNPPTGGPLPKLQGLAEYAAAHADIFRRVESVAEVDKKLRVLDLTRDEVRKGVADAKDIVALYQGELASDYY